MTKETSHYMLRVLRLKLADEICLFNGSGSEFMGQIVAIQNKRVEVAILQVITDKKVESGLNITLVQSISRAERMDLTMQKAVELGVNRIVPVITEYSVVKLNQQRQQSRLLHWQQIIIAAAQQCGRVILPVLDAITDLPDWLTENSDKTDTLRVILHPNSHFSFHDCASSITDLILLSGPEGGFSEHEVVAVTGQGFQALSLGNRILRTETAALTALSIAQHRWGDL